MRIINIYSKIALTIAFFSFWSCNRDSLDWSNTTTISLPTPLVYEEITSTIVGYVYDENNQPLKDVIVSTYSSQTKTDEKGIFVFLNIKMDAQGTYVKMDKKGFLAASDFVYPSEGNIAYSRAQMTKYKLENVLRPDRPNTVKIKGGVEVQFQEESFLDIYNQKFTEKLFVSASYISPNDANISDLMPGALLARDKKGNNVVLGTLGMIGLELHDELGNRIKLDPKKPAQISFPIINEYAPDEIELWHFDEQKGLWEEAGLAYKEGNTYKATVTHFSFWNLDKPFPMVRISGRLLDISKKPLQYINVSVHSGTLGVGYSKTDSKGEFKGWVPKSELLKLTFSLAECGKVIYTDDIGPLENDVILNDVVANIDISKFTIKGHIVCNTDQVKNGIVVITAYDKTFMIAAENDGSFEHFLSNAMCFSDIKADVFAYDMNTQNASNKTSITETIGNPYLLNVCDQKCAFNPRIAYNCKDSLEVIITDGQGPFTYLWNNGITTRSVSSALNIQQPNTTFCVTVTDLSNNCEKTICQNYVYFDRLTIDIEACTAFINIYDSGRNYFTYLWSNNAKTPETPLDTAGNYCVTVTDPFGCSKVACKAYLGSPQLDLDPKMCSKNEYVFEGENLESVGIGINNYNMPLKINVFETGFEFEANLYNRDCNNIVNIQLPTVITMPTFQVTNTSCGSCSDGHIEVTIPNNAQCLNCQIGSIKVLNADNINLDMTTANTNNNLNKGPYYVVIEDANTGCYIFAQKININ